MYELSLESLGSEAEPDNGQPKNFLLSMAHHLVRSLLTRIDDDLSLLVVVQNKKAAEAIHDVICHMNSMSYDHRYNHALIAKSNVSGVKKAMVMVNTQYHPLFTDALSNGNDTRRTLMIVQGDLMKGSPLAELATKREAELYKLI